MSNPSSFSEHWRPAKTTQVTTRRRRCCHSPSSFSILLSSTMLLRSASSARLSAWKQEVVGLQTGSQATPPPPFPTNQTLSFLHLFELAAQFSDLGLVLVLVVQVLRHNETERETANQRTEITCSGGVGGASRPSDHTHSPSQTEPPET